MDRYQSGVLLLSLAPSDNIYGWIRSCSVVTKEPIAVHENHGSVCPTLASSAGFSAGFLARAGWVHASSRFVQISHSSPFCQQGRPHFWPRMSFCPRIAQNPKFDSVPKQSLTIPIDILHDAQLQHSRRHVQTPNCLTSRPLCLYLLLNPRLSPWTQAEALSFNCGLLSVHQSEASISHSMY